MCQLTLRQQQDLAAKKLKGTITDEENALLEAWYMQEPGSEMLWDSEEAASREVLKNRLFNKIRRNAGISGKLIFLKNKTSKIAAAASIIILIGTGSYLLRQHYTHQPAIMASVNARRQDDVAPGHNGAILTLADGSQVVLDNAKNGNIAIQGNSRIVKQNGLLIYKAAKTVDPEIINYNTMYTSRGRQFQFVLPDGSKVWLNSASSITYPTAFTGTERTVKITGEAYFEVTKKPEQPFVVIANETKVEVLGTHFNIMAYTDETAVKTTLLEGSVKFYSLINGAPNGLPVLLIPGQQGQVDNKTKRITTHEADTEDATAWIHGQLNIKSEDIRSFMRQVARWYDVDIVFEGSAPSLSFSGYLDKNVNLSYLLKALNDNGVPTKLEGRKVIIPAK
jgi:ferric-dicitrate binding protein FerR (iron transport regulator)